MFSVRLNEMRKNKGFTALFMANSLGMHIRAYRKYESAHSSPPIETLVKIADILDVSTDYLLCRDAFVERHGLSGRPGFTNTFPDSLASSQKQGK